MSALNETWDYEAACRTYVIHKGLKEIRAHISRSGKVPGNPGERWSSGQSNNTLT